MKIKHVVHRGNGGDADTPTDGNPEPEVVEAIEVDEPQPESLNRFLSYIGVRFFDGAFFEDVAHYIEQVRDFRLVTSVPKSSRRVKDVDVGPPVISTFT